MSYVERDQLISGHFMLSRELSNYGEMFALIKRGPSLPYPNQIILL